MARPDRLPFIDNIRIFLTAIVILHHLGVSYGAPGGWYYQEFDLQDLDTLTLTILVLFAAANQAYFMGFFFFLGGFFSGKSLENQDARKYLTQRLLRLGLPILVFVYLISPLIRLFMRARLFKLDYSLASLYIIYQNLDFGIELGPMWFVILLLILTFALVALHKIAPVLFRPTRKQLSRRNIILFALCIGILTFLVRVTQPVGTVFKPLNLQIPFALQYIFLYSAGCLTYRQRWLDQLDRADPKFWGYLLAALLLIMPLIFLLSGGLQGDLTPALGGWHWQSAAYSIWEQLFCFSIMIIILTYFRSNLNHTGWITQELAASSYATFIIHPFVLVALTIALKDIALHPLLKITLAAFPAIILCFLAGSLLRRLPGLRKIV